MKGENLVILIGSLGADPETRYSANGSAITAIKLATSKEWKDKITGEKKEHTEWHKVKFFGKLAEIAGKYLKKGSSVYVKGELKTEDYEKDGVKRYFTNIIAGEMQMLGGKPESKPVRDGNMISTLSKNTTPPTQSTSRLMPMTDGDPIDDDIPFLSA